MAFRGIGSMLMHQTCLSSPTASGRAGHNSAHNWFQCRDTAVQKHQVPSAWNPACLSLRSVALDLLALPQVWDLGGQSSIRPYWRCYYPNTDAIIFVVDSADTDRLATAKVRYVAALVPCCCMARLPLPALQAELHAMLEEEDLKDAILLVMANKQDEPGALRAQGIAEGLALSTLKSRQWNIQETCATQGKGLFDGFDWLVQCIKGGSGDTTTAPPVATSAPAGTAAAAEAAPATA